MLNVRTLNINKTKFVEKGIGTLLLEYQYFKAIKFYLDDIRFDLITYSTPPVNLTNVIKYLKKKNPNAMSYLQLKDIYPQNAVDLGLFSKNSIFYWYFRRKEKTLYLNSDYIGCISPENVNYIKYYNPYYPSERIEIAPNSIDVKDNKYLELSKEELSYVRSKYNLPINKPIFIYGGNFGKPQCIDYVIQCLETVINRNDCFFLMVGSGTDFCKLARWYTNHKNKNVKVMESLSRDEYDVLVRACDIGLIFLDHRFTIPNYPQRLLNYLANKKPVVCATDANTDIGRIAENNGYGYWCQSLNPYDFSNLVEKMLNSNIKLMGEKGYQYMLNNYLVEHTYYAIIKHLRV